LRSIIFEAFIVVLTPVSGDERGALESLHLFQILGGEVNNVHDHIYIATVVPMCRLHCLQHLLFPVIESVVTPLSHRDLLSSHYPLLGQLCEKQAPCIRLVFLVGDGLALEIRHVWLVRIGGIPTTQMMMIRTERLVTTSGGPLAKDALLQRLQA
jgi:hypothetical protein